MDVNARERELILTALRAMMVRVQKEQAEIKKEIDALGARVDGAQEDVVKCEESLARAKGFVSYISKQMEERTSRSAGLAKTLTDLEFIFDDLNKEWV